MNISSGVIECRSWEQKPCKEKMNEDLSSHQWHTLSESECCSLNEHVTGILLLLYAIFFGII